MDRNAILNAMEKKAKAIFSEKSGYINEEMRGVMAVDIRNQDYSGQWDSSCRNFGASFMDCKHEGELIIGNGVNFDAQVHGKIAYSRRTNKNSGTNYYQVLEFESFWMGSIISDDGNCICAIAGLRGEDDVAIARAGINCYESLKRGNAEMG